MDYPKSVAGVGLVDGKFVDEDKNVPRAGSLIPSVWGNNVTDSIMNVQDAAGLVAAENDTTQLLEAIKILSLRQVVGVVGQSRNAKIKVTGTSTAVYTTDELVVASALGGTRHILSKLNKSIDLTKVGVMGMNQGPVPVNGFVAVYVLYDPVKGLIDLVGQDTTNMVAPEIYSAGGVDPGYTESALVGFLPTNASRQIVPGTNVKDRWVHRPALVVFNSSAVQPGFAPLSIEAGVPRNVRRVRIMFSSTCNTPNTTQTVSLFMDASGSGQISQAIPCVVSGNGATSSAVIDVFEGQTLYFSTSNTPNNGSPTFIIYVTGFEF